MPTSIPPSENDQQDDEFRSLTDAEREYVRRLGNPYASLAVGLRATDRQPGPAQVPPSAAAPATRAGISQRDFEAGCRAVFRQYIPPAEKGRLRPHHRAFMDRNRVRSPIVRLRLLERLRTYDLSDMGSLEPHFNRERGDLTEAKLAQIERSVLVSEAAE